MPKVDISTVASNKPTDTQTTAKLRSAPSPRILVFDSGVGGLSIAAEIQQQHPHCSIIYASDNGAFPYGTKSEDELVERVGAVLTRLLADTPVDIIVIACNSASTLALPHIRNRFRQPIVGVVPAIKPAAELSRTGTIGLLATPGTIKRQYTQQLIHDFAPHNRVISIGSSELVELAEQKIRGKQPCRQALSAILEPFFSDTEHPPVDTIVLACTHFPLLKAELQDVIGASITWVDSGEAIARRVGYWLNELALDHGRKQNSTDDNSDDNRPPPAIQQHSQHQPRHQPQHQSLFTRASEDVESLRPYLAQQLGGPLQFLEI